MNEKNFSNENDELMFYHTTLRNVISLTTLGFVCLTFSETINKKINNLILKILSFIFLLIAFYFNYNLIELFSTLNKNYKFVGNYLNINYSFILILVIIEIFIIYKILMLLMKK